MEGAAKRGEEGGLVAPDVRVAGGTRSEPDQQAVVDQSEYARGPEEEDSRCLRLLRLSNSHIARLEALLRLREVRRNELCVLLRQSLKHDFPRRRS